MLFSATIALSIAQIIMALTTTYYTTCTIPVMALENAMTCRVHRAVILGLINDRDDQTTPFVLTAMVWRTTENDNTTPKERGPDASDQV